MEKRVGYYGLGHQKKTFSRETNLALRIKPRTEGRVPALRRDVYYGFEVHGEENEQPSNGHYAGSLWPKALRRSQGTDAQMMRVAPSSEKS